MIIDTTPPGAMVYLDDNPVGESPITVPFTYYGTRKITLEKVDAQNRLLYKRKIVFEEIKAPMYQYFPLDFFSEVLLPLKLEDNHIFSYNLEELIPQAREELQEGLFENAEELREKAFAPSQEE
ncbi:MAG: PEGA domain-containing protein [Candidatus Brocadiales bacterium]